MSHNTQSANRKRIEIFCHGMTVFLEIDMPFKKIHLHADLMLDAHASVSIEQCLLARSMPTIENEYTYLTMSSEYLIAIHQEIGFSDPTIRNRIYSFAAIAKKWKTILSENAKRDFLSSLS